MATELYIKFKETHSEEDFNKLNTYIQEPHKIGEDLYENDDIEFTDGGVLQFYSLQGIKEYFEIVHIQTQELTSIGFKTAILDL